MQWAKTFLTAFVCALAVGLSTFIAAVSLTTSSAQAGVVHDQPPATTSGPASQGLCSDSAGGECTQIMADDFQLGVTTAIISLRWYGLYLDGSMLPLAPFEIRIYDNSFDFPSHPARELGLPGNLLFQQSVTVTGIDSGLTNRVGGKIYRYESSRIAVPVLTAGIRYWLSIFETDSTTLVERDGTGTIVKSNPWVWSWDDSDNYMAQQPVLDDEWDRVGFNVGYTGFAFALFTHLNVGIDIKPGKDRNRVNLCAKHGLPVAILSSESFDAPAEVDPTTVSLEGAGVKLDKKGNPVAKTRDVNDDGLTDLVVKIVTEDLELESGDIEAKLTGQTFDGTPIEGTDTVQVKQQMCVRTLE